MRKPRMTKLGQGVGVRAHYPNDLKSNTFSEYKYLMPFRLEGNFNIFNRSKE